MTLAEWVAGTTPYPRPTYDDLAYHLSTLFPPVRPQGWLELRSIDALPDDLWPVAVAVTAALVEDPVAGETALAAVESAAAVEPAAYAREALADPRVRAAAEACFTAAAQALPRLGAAGLVEGVDAYLDRYVARGRTPADDVLDARRARSTAGRDSRDRRKESA
jgi:glutamate--cysteine ligase